MSKNKEPEAIQLTYADVVDNIGHFADMHMESLSADDQLQLIEVSKKLAQVCKREQLTPEQVIALSLSLAVEFMRFSPEYDLTKNKTVDEFQETAVCPLRLVN